MPFNAFSYFLFLPVVFLIHYYSPDRFRWLVLLGASFFFYAALKAPHLILVLLLVTFITYYAGILIDLNEAPRTRRCLLWIGIAANVLTLITLKYLPLLTKYLNDLLRLVLPVTAFSASKAIIAIGVSYFIFQAISYLIDIYLEVEKPERHFGRFTLYMSFFPKLLQGPIERAGDLLPQLKKPYEFDYDNTRSAMLMFTWGLFKKVVIADRLALLVDPVYNNVHNYSGLVLVVVTYVYALQIFFDFSGYTDMALGTARMFNVKLTQNFNNPYLATSIADFWRRWHISFSHWILDYVFKPLQMQWRDWKTWGPAAALMVTFLISGIWHGGRWTFIVWGGLHGLYLVCSGFYKPLQKSIHKQLGLGKSILLKWWQVIFTFNLVCFAWIFFRANSLKDAIYIVTHLITQNNDSDKIIYGYFASNKITLLAIAFIIIISCCGFKQNVDTFSYVISRPAWKRWGIYSIMLYTVIFSFMLVGSNSNINKQTFIYSKF